VLLVGLLAGALSGVVGTGSSLLLMPVLVWMYGPQQAVPVMAVAAVIGNLGKLLAWRRLIDWRACAAFSATALPAAALGVRTLLALPPRVVEGALGVFFLAMIPVRHALARRQLKLTRLHLACIGAPIGFLTAIAVSTGPLTVPIFVMHGLDKGAFIATEAAASLAMYGAKVAAFRWFSALQPRQVLLGLIVGATLMAGTFAARPLLLKLPPQGFRRLIDGLMLLSGLSLLATAAIQTTA